MVVLYQKHLVSRVWLTSIDACVAAS